MGKKYLFGKAEPYEAPPQEIPMDQALVNAKLNKIAQADANLTNVLNSGAPVGGPDYEQAHKALQAAHDEFDLWKNDTIKEIAKQGPSFWKQIKLTPDFLKRTGKARNISEVPKPKVPEPAKPKWGESPAREKMMDEANKEIEQVGKPPKKNPLRNYGG